MLREDMLEKMVQCFNTCSKMGYSIPECMDRVLEVCEENKMSPPPNPQAADLPGLGQLCGWEYGGENHE